jgi:hypothetical protein
VVAPADPLAPLSPSADGPLTLAVECRTEPNRPGNAHQITLDTEWQVHTPHDLDAERVAQAFGGYLSCLELVDKVVPALAGLVQLVGRRRLPDVRRAGSADWRIAVPAQGCRCQGTSFRAPELAAFHARGVEHWAALWGLSRNSVRLLAHLVDQVARAHGITERLGEHPARSEVLEGSGLDDLWQAGLHPELVTALHQGVWPGGSALPARFYLGATWLLLRLLASGGRLEVETRYVRGAIDELRGASYLPDGKLLKIRGRGWYHQLLYLREDPRAGVPEREVRVPSRSAKPHPIARAYREDRDRHEVSASELARATRLVHALATTFDELGYDCRVGGHPPDGQFRVTTDGWDVPLRVSEKSAPGGAPIPYYIVRRGRPLPAWQARRQKEFIPTGLLTILVGGQYGGPDRRQRRFSDTKSRRLEDLLPAVVREVEMRFFERRQDHAEAEREDHEQEQRWQTVLADAEFRATEAFRAEVLAQRAARWRAWHEQTRYVEELADRAWAMPETEQADGAEWLTWARQHLAATDPSKARHGMPETPKPTKEFVEPHIRGWVGAFRSFNA